MTCGWLEAAGHARHRAIDDRGVYAGRYRGPIRATVRILTDPSGTNLSEAVRRPVPARRSLVLLMTPPSNPVRSRQLFPTWSNSLFRFAIGVAIAGVVGIPVFLMAWVRTPYATGQHELIEQPIKFDHRHHVRDDGISCEYCHSGVSRSAYAGIPAASVCMGCHSQVWTSSPELTRLRTSWFDQTPLVWTRVNNLPRHVFFNHSIHVAKGVGCVTCHGRVDLMASVYQEHSLLMQWCLDCHRHPEEYLRPREKVTDMEWVPDRPQAEIGREVRAELNVHPTTDCTGCHR
jgi:hypothetical protein